jgi:UDP-N-acetylglucosamine 2-epimerase (non-hydrolysing)/GDP/UDP-N,N'-diacetylbacillosamine 2-epimerase (hydrolysing)
MCKGENLKNRPKKRKIAVLSTGRQDWGILRSIVIELITMPEFSFSIIAGGMACDKRFGDSATQIESEGIPVHARLKWKILSDGSASSVCTEMAKAIVMSENCLSSLSPDALMLVGDRFETMAVAQTATILRIPLIHIHGGEETRGAMDNQIRHAISKMSHVHFASNKLHAERLVRMGENPKYVYNTGAPGIDNLKRNDLPDIADVMDKLGFERNDEAPLFLITYHPPTLIGNARIELKSLLDAIDGFDAYCIFTLPNNDLGNSFVRKEICRFVSRKPSKRKAVPALGEKTYWTVLKSCDLVLGNSSSGVIEAPAVPVPVINIGERQSGREMAPCVMNLPNPSSKSVSKAIRKSLECDFRKGLSPKDSPYGNGGVAKKICGSLKKIDFKMLSGKSFYEGGNKCWEN